MVRKCGVCDLSVNRNDSFIDCDACKIPHHKKCCKLPDAVYSAVSSNKGLVKWFCRLCDSHVADILNNFEKFKKINQETKKMRDEMNSKLASLEQRLEICEKIESPVLTSAIKKVVNQSLPEMSVDGEREAIEKKKNNLIYFKIPESSSDNVENRLKHDFECLQKVYDTDFVMHNDISNLFRVGKKNENNARPLVVKFRDTETKEKFIARTFGKELSLTIGNEIIKIAASRDKTIKQREEYKKCLDELNERSKNEENLIIRGNKVIKNFRASTGGTKTLWASIKDQIN